VSYAKPEPVIGSKTLPPAIAAPPSAWSKYWILMWVVIAVGLLAAAPFPFKPGGWPELPFYHWLTAAAVFFGIPELIGARVQNDAFPPLTHVIVRYVHAELAMPLLYGMSGGILSYWFGFPNPDRVAALCAGIGWFDAHFLLRYVPRRNP
jgi:hypothetical protein